MLKKLVAKIWMSEEFKKGECVPVASTDKCGNMVEIFCQNCTKAMTQREHKEYFDEYIPWFEKKFKREYSMERPNYDFRDEKAISSTERIT